MRVLAGDIGGTTSRLAMVSARERTVRITQSQHYRSRDYASLAPIVHSFLQDIDETPDRACFGIAGMVHDGRSTLTNLPWTLNVRSLAGEIGIPRTQLVNDMVAAAYGVQRVLPRDLVTLQAGHAAMRVRGPQAVIAAGTGLGQAFVTWEGDQYVAHASEGGHATFAARNDTEWQFARFLGARFGAVSCERVISGPGLVNIYRYLCGEDDGSRHESLAALKSAPDSAAWVTDLALHDADPIATQAVDMFMAAYGAQAGNFALSVLATGGVYLTGGIAPRIVSKLGNGTFMRAFLDKGRLSATLARIPVHIVIDPDVGLIGAGVLAARL
jgi:glucokinase